MEVGSLVKCIDNKGIAERDGIVPSLKEIYTIRGIGNPHSKRAIYLDGVINRDNYYHLGEEVGYNPARFRELLPPMVNIEEHIRENTQELVEEQNESRKFSRMYR